VCSTTRENHLVVVVQIKSFAAVNSVHVWLVAHPRQLQQWKGDAPTLYDIAGSAHFINKADIGLVVHRDFDGAIAQSQGDGENDRDRGESSTHPLADDPYACRVIIRKVLNLPSW
jgi:hypothetical protein